MTLVVAGIAWMDAGQGKCRMLDYDVVGREFELVVGTEVRIIILPLRRRIDPASLVPAERALLVVACNDVLPQLRSYGFEQIPQVPDDGIVPKYGVLPLHDVMDYDASEKQHE